MSDLLGKEKSIFSHPVTLLLVPLREAGAPICPDPAPRSNCSGLTDVDFTTYLWQQFTWISWFDSLLFWNMNTAWNYLGSGIACISRFPGQKRKMLLYSGLQYGFPLEVFIPFSPWAFEVASWLTPVVFAMLWVTAQLGRLAALPR